MQVTNPKELFIRLLSDVHLHEERVSVLYRQLQELSTDPVINESLDALLFLNDKTISTIRKCFDTIGENPVPASSRLQDVFLDDFRNELNEIHTSTGKVIYAAARLNQLLHLRIGELASLVALSGVTGNNGIGLLLGSIFADKRAVIDQIRQRIRDLVDLQLE